jgi:lipoprotein-anchoring transpeptidase ErfK/SrfK
MRRTLFRPAMWLTVGAASVMLSGCTVEDASDKRAADSVAATQSVAGQSTPMPAAPATPQVSQTMATNAGAVASDSGVMVSGATPSGSLSPDSVDVGRRATAETHPLSATRLEVDLTARRLYVYDGDRRVASYRVAVGSPQWPTQTGEWSVKQVVWNPEWVPPDESWAEQRTPKKPGAPDNPLGRAQLVYDPPRTIHGTNEPASIGRAVSHGSIRLANADVVQLARRLMETAGVKHDDAWYRNVQLNRTEKVPVDLPQRVSIRVY